MTSKFYQFNVATTIMSNFFRFLNRILNKIFSPLFNIFRYFGSLLIYNKYLSTSKFYTNYTMLIHNLFSLFSYVCYKMKTFIKNILQRSKDLICNDSYILRIILCGLLIILISLYSNIGIYFIKLFISFLIFHFIFNKFTFSEYKYIRFIQKAILYIIYTYIVVYLLGWIDISLNKFISDFNFLGNFDLNKFYSYLDTLSLHQEGALFNIIVLLVILLTVFSIIGVFFGNEIIKYFDLENKYPRLNTFLK
uniref:hypothetical protein n=1 Tax=Trametes maxima TaxID=259368 RepID=UPI0030021AF2|nr:hypothetical protein [Trametes maxima]